MKNEIIITEAEYKDLLNTAINQIHTARNTLALQVNTTTNTTYWNLGMLLHDREIEGGYGSKTIRRLSIDLKEQFPDMGLSPRNLWYMKKFYERFCNSPQKVQRNVALLSWRKNILFLEKNLTDEEVFYYSTETINNNWNKDFLLNAIKMNMYETHKNELRDNNFINTLPAIHAEQANEILKDTYNLGFLGVTEPIAELELEKRLIEKIKVFMLELGKGFAYIGNQYRLEYNGKEYFVDMLFSNRKLNCLVAIELKIGEFKSEYVGKMNMYLSLLDKLEKEERENQSIGIILCAEKDHLDVQIALQDINKPIAVADYELIVPKKELQTLVLEEMKKVEIRHRFDANLEQSSKSTLTKQNQKRKNK